MMEEPESVDYKIRYGTRDDLPQVLDLIRELAVFEREPEAVINTVQEMERDGFGENTIFGLLVAEHNENVVGISVYYYRYSTWNGKCLYLEDLIVTESLRGNGIGKSLFERTIEHARKNNCKLLNLQVLDWNTGAIDFYRSYEMTFDEQWHNASLRLD